MRSKHLYDFKKILIAVFSVLFFLPTLSSQNSNIDSLSTLLKRDKQDTNKVIHLYKLSWQYIKVGQYDTAIHYSNKAIKLADQLNFKRGISASYGNIGYVFSEQGEYNKALDYYLKALEIDKKLGDKFGVERHLGNIGLVFSYQANYIQALDYQLQALKIAEEIKDKNSIATHLCNIGFIYWNQKNYTKATDYFLRSLKIAEKINDQDLMIYALGSIANTYSEEANALTDSTKRKELFNKASEYYFNALTIANRLDDKNGTAIWLGNIGELYRNMGDYSKASEYYLQSLKIAQELKNKHLISNCFGNLGIIYTKLKKFDMAEMYLKTAISMDTVHVKNELSQYYELLSQLYDNTALSALNKGNWEKAARDYKLSLAYYKKCTVLKDSIFSQESKKELVRKEMNYEFDKKEAAIKAENEKQQIIAEEKNRKQKIISWIIAGGLLSALVFSLFIFRSLRIAYKQKQIIERKNNETLLQKKTIEEKNKDITDSIHYAKRIQNALLREEEHISAHLPEHFILFLPKDIVSGDFYWGTEKQEYWYFAVADCTGHGVPGAIMSMLGISFLNDIVLSEALLNPAEILNALRDRVVMELRQTDETIGNKDGMDISLCRLNLKTLELHWAGANNPLNIIHTADNQTYEIHPADLKEIRADKQPIGYHPGAHPFTNYTIQLKKGDCIYLYSDGYADQFGGADGKKLKHKQLTTLFINNHRLPMKQQKQFYKKYFSDWKGPLEQVDDVCIFGVRV
jgi:tetratricopeptide (TPR) repeat protein